MHKGSFPPRRPDPADCGSYLPGSWRPGQLDPDLVQSRTTRRQWLFGAGCFAAGLGVTWGALAWVTRGDRPAEAAARPIEPPVLGTPEWAVTMFDKPIDELLKWSGDLERASYAAPQDSRFLLCFETILDGALSRPSELSDLAAACAVRSLVRLGRPHAVRVRAREIEAQPWMLETRIALERSLPEQPRGR